MSLVDKLEAEGFKQEATYKSGEVNFKKEYEGKYTVEATVWLNDEEVFQCFHCDLKHSGIVFQVSTITECSLEEAIELFDSISDNKGEESDEV